MSMTAMLGVARDLRFSRTAHFRPALHAACRARLPGPRLGATFDKIAAAPGAGVLQEPVTQPWGDRDIAVRDPAGHHVRIEQG